MIGDETKCQKVRRRKRLNKGVKVNDNKHGRKGIPNDNNSIKACIER